MHSIVNIMHTRVALCMENGYSVIIWTAHNYYTKFKLSPQIIRMPRPPLSTNSDSMPGSFLPGHWEDAYSSRTNKNFTVKNLHVSEDSWSYRSDYLPDKKKKYPALYVSWYHPMCWGSILLWMIDWGMVLRIRPKMSHQKCWACRFLHF